MSQRVVLINPPICAVKGDIAGTGAVYWPITLAYVAEIIKDNYDVKVFDMFGLNPKNKIEDGNVFRFGIDHEYVGAHIRKGDVVVLYSGSAAGHKQVLNLIKKINLLGPKRVIVIENSNSANAYPLDMFKNDFDNVGAVIIPGHPFDVICNAIDGNYEYSGRIHCGNFKGLKFPTWNGFPIENYWELDYAHAPKTHKKYIQIYTSWGCPNACNFCVSPYMCDSSWNHRYAEQVALEMKYWNRRDVFEFHIEDLNPTVNKDRILSLCLFIDMFNIKADIKIASGTKIDDIDEEMIVVMAKAGLTYLSFSPESGYWATLISMNKRFDYEHAEKILDIINNSKKVKNKIITQACFIIGYPGSDDRDIDWTCRYIDRLLQHGLDEIALFSFCPTPGSTLWNECMDVSAVNFTYGSKRLKDIRRDIVLSFYANKLVFNTFWFFGRFFKTKTWMTIKRLGANAITGLL